MRTGSSILAREPEVTGRLAQELRQRGLERAGRRCKLASRVDRALSLARSLRRVGAAGLRAASPT